MKMIVRQVIGNVFIFVVVSGTVREASGQQTRTAQQHLPHSRTFPPLQLDTQNTFQHNSHQNNVLDRSLVPVSVELSPGNDARETFTDKHHYEAHDNPRYLNDYTEFGFSRERYVDNDYEDYDPICPTSIRKIQKLNKTKTMDNGKVYAITKVIKSRKCARNKMPKDKLMQRRTFNVIPNLSFMLPIPWLTKKPEEIDRARQYKSFHNNSSGLQRKEKIQTEVPNSDESGSESQDNHQFGLDKYKKVLNLFTIVKFENTDCYVNELKGTCLHQIECDGKGGKSIGICAQGFGVCCYVERTCGERTRENCTYFVNEGFPKPSTTSPKVCTLIVDKSHPDVLQLRLEFMIFELRGPSNGTCISDRFTVTGHNTNHIVPDICGINNQQHVYIDIDESSGPYSLSVITMESDFPRTFQIKVTQIKKDDELLAPKNCLQYYTDLTGTVQTFNYQHTSLENSLRTETGYFNNLNYAICLRKHVGFCSVSYENEEQVNSRANPSFQLLNTDQDGERLLPPNEGGAEVFDCPDDYIIVNGVRLCGEKLNDASLDADYTKNIPVTDFSNGPFILQMRTNNAVNGRGFYLKYRQNPCL